MSFPIDIEPKKKSPSQCDSERVIMYAQRIKNQENGIRYLMV